MAAVCWLALGLPAAAQQAVRVPQLTLRAFVNRDASLGLIYDARITNGGDAPVSILRFDTSGDVALPSITASLDGALLEDFRQPRYSRPGFEVLFGRRALPPGKQGHLRLEFTIEQGVYTDDRPGHARLELLPNALAGQAVDDTTDLTVVAHLPPGVRPKEVVLNSDSAAFGTFDGRTTVTWHILAAQLPGMRPLVVSFPAAEMTGLARRSALASAAQWLERSLPLRICAGLGSLLLFGFAFLRCTGGRHVAAALVLGAMLTGLFLKSPAGQLLAIPALILLSAAVEVRRLRSFRRPIRAD